MTKRRAGELRRRAESALQRKGKNKGKAKGKPPKRRATPSAPIATESTEALVHELEVHQVELELQNEELRSSRSAAEAALERYTEVFEFAPIGYATLGIDGSILSINHAGAALLGLPRSLLIGKLFQTYVAAGSLVTFDTVVQRALDDATPGRSEIELLRQDHRVIVRVTAGGLRRPDVSVLLAFEDITESRKKADALARSEQALRELNERKDEFMAMLSHEVRNPLSPIRTSISVLKRAPAGSDEASNALAILERSATHLTRLVDDLLDVTRIARNKVTLQRAPVELVAIVRRTLGDQADAFAAKDIAVRLHDHAGQVWVHGDSARLVQVFSNVLGNAEKFTPPGGKVDVTIEIGGRFVVVRIADTGAGIAPDVLEHVFEPFAQGPQSLERKHGGLGLGLALVSSVVELHGGKATIRSDGPGRGTEVSIAIPAEQPRELEPTVAAKPDGATRKVLVVEDIADAAEALRYLLSLGGHTVEVARDGRTAVEIALRSHPDIVFCDLGLPDMDGYEVARTLRREPRLNTTALVALSGYARPEDVERARSAGFDRHLAKPPSPEDLFDLVATARQVAPG